MNPWISVWTRPRETIRGIVEENPNRSLWLLASIYGFSSLMNLFQSMALGNSLSTVAIVGLAVVLAPIWGYVNFAVWTWFVSVIGKWMKGQGRFSEIRAAYAWSCVPITLNIPLWLLMVVLFGHQLFLNFPNAYQMQNAQVVILFTILIAKVVLSIWSLVIFLNALAEVQKYSILKAIFNVILAGVVLGVILFVITTLLAYEAGGHKLTAFMKFF